MEKQKDVVLDIQNVAQQIDIDNVGKKLSSMIISNVQEKMDNGNIKVTLILDPKKAKKGELNNV